MYPIYRNFLKSSNARPGKQFQVGLLKKMNIVWSVSYADYFVMKGGGGGGGGEALAVLLVIYVINLSTVFE